MLINEENYLAHYGILRKSGRYPWGSGGTSVKRSQTFVDMVQDLVRKGMTETQIAEGFGMSTTDLRATKTIANNEIKQSRITQAQLLRDKGTGYVAIGQRMGLPESSVRALLAEGARDKADQLATVVSILKDQVDKHKYIDVGAGVENYLDVSRDRLKVAISILKEQGYELHTNIKNPQAGTGKDTNYKVLTPPGTKWQDVNKNKDKIRLINEHLDDTGKSRLGMLPPIAVNPKRVAIRYKEDGGGEADGVVFVRRGVEDLSLGGAKYAQVRIQVGPKHYIKGMAMYKDDLPPGVDLLFNSVKSDTGDKLDALKVMSDDKDNPFGAVIRRQITTKNSKGEDVNTSAMNLVNEEGDWSKWSKSIAPQVLSKQSPTLAKEQLDMTFERRANELAEINSLTNPVVKRKLLMEFSEGVDAAAVHLKAANLPRQGWHAILPVKSLPDTEVYAPNFKPGERVVLIRYPHGGRFEMPELTVNNKHAESNRLLKGAKDAIGINPKVAERLSGADFDGDTVLVIPNNTGRLKSERALEGLKDFNPQETYKGYPGMKVMRNTGQEMGMISNLITDMTLRNATNSELARAVRHSMVVIDAEKKELNYKESEKRNGIKDLREKYQTKVDGTGGASTLISKAKGRAYVPDRRPRYKDEGGPIDTKTGELKYMPTGKVNYSTGKPKMIKKKALEVTDDAFELSSGTPMENLYAKHSNKLKGLANQARLTAINTPTSQRSSSAAKVYSKEVAALDNALTLAKKNAPLERRAQLIAAATLKAKKDQHPDMDYTSEKKIKFQALDEARKRTGAKKQQIVITPEQWAAIQAGAISPTKLKQILDNADLDVVRKLATPKTKKLMTKAKTSRAQSMLELGFDRGEIAAHLGVSLSTLDEAIGGA